MGTASSFFNDSTSQTTKLETQNNTYKDLRFKNAVRSKKHKYKQIETKIARSMKISNEPWESQFKIGQVEGEGLRDGGLEGEG